MNIVAAVVVVVGGGVAILSIGLSASIFTIWRRAPLTEAVL